MTKSGYLTRYRYPVDMMRCALIFHLFLPSRIVVLLLFFLFRMNVTHKTVCAWTKKFGVPKNLPLPIYAPNETLICHVDEKYVKIKGEWHYWWSIKDACGNVLDTLVTPARDLVSAKQLFMTVKRKIGRAVDLLIRDGLPAYDKAAKYLGRRCKSIVTGIKGKAVLFKKNFYWLTNNPAESLNSEIDTYLAKFQYQFANLESANRFAQLFLLQKHLKKCLTEKRLPEASSLLTQAFVL